MKKQEQLSIALVDDEKMFLRIWEIHLKRAGHNVEIFDGPDTFLKYYKRNHNGLDLIVTDWKMPSNGQRLIDTVISINPNQSFLIVSCADDDKRFKGLLVFLSKMELATVPDKVGFLLDRYKKVKNNHTRALIQLGCMGARVKMNIEEGADSGRA